MQDPSVKLFLSCVSGEFGVYRKALRQALTRPNVEVKIQEDFKLLGADTLSMLEDYIARCEAVVHFVGEMAGATPAPNSVSELFARRPNLGTKLAGLGVPPEAQARLSYTQWEAWLTIALGKRLLIVEPAASARRGPNIAPTPESRLSQAEHLRRLKAIDFYPGPAFTGPDNLVAQILNSAVIDALVKATAAASPRQPRNLPFASLGPLFAGREKDLADLRAALTSAGSAAVAGRALLGLGGIGKTRLAIEYAWRHTQDYSALLFARADDAATLDASLAALVGLLGLPEKEAREDAAKIAAVLRWLEDHPTWLLILDNVDDDKAVSAATALMAKLSGGHVIVTARAANFPATLQTLELDVLDEGAAAAFLIERTKNRRAPAADDEAKARDIARELGGLALALEQVGAFIAQERIGFARYHKLLGEQRARILDWARPELTGYPASVGATWAASVDKLKPESRRLLERLAMLAPEPIPDFLLDVAVPGEAEAYDAYEARGGLFAYSLATQAKGESAQGFIVHRLVQDFARRAVSDERAAAALREALAWINAAVPFEADDVRNWPVLDPLAPHVLAVAGRADEAGIAEPTARLLNQLAILSYAKARYAEAEPLYCQTLAILESSLGPNHPDVASGLNNLGLLLRATNRLAEAEPLFRRALKIDEASLGPDHPNVAIRLNNLALLLQDTNRLAEAQPLFRRALKIDEASYGPDHPNVAMDLNNLAELLRATNRLAEAEPLYRRALAIGETSLGPDHPEVAIRLNNLGLLLRATNRLAEAEPLFRRALKIDEASYGPDHPQVATDLNNLAELLLATNRLAEAEPLMRRALTIWEKALGANHPQVAVGLNNLAGLLYETNRVAEAEPLFRRALAIWEKALGPDHPQVASGLNNLAGLLYATNRLAEAEPLFRRALMIREGTFGPNHPDVAQSLNNLARLLQDTNRLVEAEPLFRRALAIWEKSLGPDHPSTVTVRENLTALEAARGQGA
jgi:tetratricopeptide (TPR) repeat protein